MTDDHPITPPEEVIDEWESEWHHHQGKDTYEVFMAKQAARWGADQELEACCKWLEQNSGRWELPVAIRAARRPKPPSLKKQALSLLSNVNKPVMLGTPEYRLSEADATTIRRALEQLDD